MSMYVLGRSKDMIDWGRHTFEWKQSSLLVFNKRKYISNGSIKHGFCKHRWMYIWQMFVQSYIILLQISKFPFRALKFKLELNLANVGIILQSVWNPSGNQFEKFLVTSGYCKISFSYWDNLIHFDLKNMIFEIKFEMFWNWNVSLHM